MGCCNFTRLFLLKGDPADPMLEGSHHQVAHVLDGDAAGGEEALASRSRQSSANATQPISKPSERQRRLRSFTAIQPSLLQALSQIGAGDPHITSHLLWSSLGTVSAAMAAAAAVF